MARIAVLGAGLVGSAIVKDLSKVHHVRAVDLNIESLARLSNLSNVETEQADVADRVGLRQAVRDADLVVSAVPGHLGFGVLSGLIEAGINTVDIAFAPENALDLHDQAVDHGVTALVDFGVAPGMDNLFLGYHDAHMVIEDFECMVGGLPKERVLPFEYKAPFSPIDVIEEYTRPARLQIDGAMVTKPALTDIETIIFEGVGTLEAFNTDGLRSLLHTMPHIPNMREKTLRYPGHAAIIKLFKESGLLSDEPVTIGSTTITPRTLTANALIKAWRLHPGEEELTAMRVTIRGSVDDSPKTIRYELLDTYDRETGITSMARTTGYACTGAVNLLLDGLWSETGVFPPERIGRSQQCYMAIMAHLKERNVHYSVCEHTP